MTKSPAATVATLKVISDRVHAKHTRERQQRRLLSDEEIDHETIRAKLAPLLDSPSFRNYERCGKEVIYRVCKNCESSEQFFYRCSIKWCPRCNWVITKRRTQLLKRWMFEIKQPKHIVLTMRNFQVLTKAKLRQFQKAMAKLRRQDVWSQVKGGCVSIEITNEGRGWHVHSHWLVDARFVDMKLLAEDWGRLVGQEFGIVHYRRVEDESYMSEVTKYVVKPGQMAAWPAEQINEFVRAIHGRRFFFVFGSLFKEQRRIKQELESLKTEQKPCTCGNCNFLFLTEADSVLRDIRRQEKNAGRRKH